jgi:hypothetical protein
MIESMGRHRGSKARTGEAALEHSWRRLHAAGKVEMVLNAKDPPWLDADTLGYAATNAVPGLDLAGYTWTRGERETLCELAVHAYERDGSRPAIDVEHLASAVVQHGLDDALTRAFLQRLGAAYPKAKIPST